jgi:hypothetical protein
LLRKPFPSAGSAAAGARERVVAGARVPAGAGSAGFSSVAPVDADGISVGPGATSLADIGEALGSVAAIRAFAVGGADASEDFFVEVAFDEAVAEAAFALDVEAGVAEAEAEAGADAGEARPRSSAAKADDPHGNPKTANSMAATATLTSLSLGVAQMRVL